MVAVGRHVRPPRRRRVGPNPPLRTVQGNPPLLEIMQELQQGVEIGQEQHAGKSLSLPRQRDLGSVRHRSLQAAGDERCFTVSEATVTVPVAVDEAPSIVAAMRTSPRVVRQAWRNLGVGSEIFKALISLPTANFRAGPRRRRELGPDGAIAANRPSERPLRGRHRRTARHI